MKRILIYGDSNSWGYPVDGSGKRMADRWPVVMQRHMSDVELIEENLPGRTTIHDDVEHLGQANNGLRFLEVALRSHAPLDAVVILLGVNDLKARFAPSPEKIADNVGKLVDEVRRVGGGTDVWEDTTPPKIFVVTPPSLSERAVDPTWERVAEWSGGREASQGFAQAFSAMGEARGVPVFDADHYIEGGAEDPIHWTQESHLRLGQAIAHWLTSQIS